MRPTTRCIKCQTTISVGELTCWACGVVQALPARPPQPIQATVAGLRHSAPPFLPVPPEGWEPEQLPDGSVVLRRTGAGWRRFGGKFPEWWFPSIGLLAVYLTSVGLTRAPGLTSLATLFLLLALVAFGAATLAWGCFGREVWRLTSGRIEVRRECLGYQWGRSYLDPELLIRSIWRSNGPRSNSYRVFQLIVRERGTYHVLAATNARRAASLQALAEYLCNQTGTSLQLPSDWPPKPEIGEWF